MTPEDKIILLCCRQDFQDQHGEAIRDLVCRFPIHWELVFSTVNEHGIAPLVGMNLTRRCGKEVNLPGEVAQNFSLYTYRQVIRQEFRFKLLKDGLEFLNHESLNTMLVKGVASSILVYEYPWYTVPQDTDIIIQKKKCEFTTQELAKINDYFHQKGIEFDFFEHHDISMNGMLLINFEMMWQDAVSFVFQGQTTSIMCPEDQLISLCINSCRKRYFRLKSLCDIAETIQRFPDLNWDSFVRKAKIYNCTWIIYAALLVVRLTLGSNFPNQLFSQLEIGTVRASLISIVIKSLLKYSSPAFLGHTNTTREIHLGLFLPYLTYRPDQLKRKIQFVRSTSGS